jgi:hypothetical protein
MRSIRDVEFARLLMCGIEVKSDDKPLTDREIAAIAWRTTA